MVRLHGLCDKIVLVVRASSGGGLCVRVFAGREECFVDLLLEVRGYEHQVGLADG
jgi:hypothetical protein